MSAPHPRIVPIPCPFPGGGLVYAYFVAGPRPTLVDSGVASSPGSAIREALAARGVRLEDIRLVVSTHGHWDHIGGAAPLRSAGATIAIHAADTPLLREREAHMAGYWGERLRLAGKPAEPGRLWLLEQIAGEIRPDREVSAGETIDLGDARLTVVHTPGHSAGSISLWWEAERVVLVGDAVQGSGSAGSRCPFYVDPDAYRASLDTLDALRAEALCGGHLFRWGTDAAWLTGRAAVRRALALSRESEGLLRSAAAERDPHALLAGAFGWDARTAPEPLGITLAGYRAG